MGRLSPLVNQTIPVRGYSGTMVADVEVFRLFEMRNTVNNFPRHDDTNRNKQNKLIQAPRTNISREYVVRYQQKTP